MAAHLILHIPKTGGTRLGELLEGSPNIHFIQVKGEPLAEQTRMLTEFYHRHADNDRPVVLMGHFITGLHERLGCEPRYYTLFRDPVERDVSGYEYIRGNPDHPEYSVANRLGMIEFITTRWPPDVQLRHVLGNCEMFYGKTTQDSVNEAGRRLYDWFRVVGGHEHYREFVSTLFSHLGLTPPEVETIPTRGAERVGELEPQELEVLKSRNILDYKLWRGDWKQNVNHTNGKFVWHRSGSPQDRKGGGVDKRMFRPPPRRPR